MAKSSFFSGTGTTSNDVDSVTSSKAAAAASATNAATSETNAAASASSASTSATNASTSASNASNSATAAATSENNAASSATAASASQTSATNSASAAATSATNAATSEANAATSNTNAASSATAAATSATSAATSLSNIGAAETNAANSATAAATSATNASTSATNAATSETNAATSASTASTAATNAATSETNASTSATSAATSATNAATSETNAATSATSASTSASAASTSATAAAASQSAAAASAASAASAYDTFDDRYLGSKTADPTVDNDGDALVAGALYFNSTANEMRVYDGANWIAATSAGNASLLEYKYTATSGQTTFSGADDSSNALSYTQNNLIVTLNGVVLENGTDYTATTGTSVVLASGAATSDELNVIAFKSFTTADMVSSTNGGTFYNDIAISGDLTVDTNVLHVDSTNNRVGIGTTSPAYKLDVSGGSIGISDGQSLISSGATQSYFTLSSGASEIGYQGTLNFRAFNSGSPLSAMHLSSAGNVGIGTSSPNSPLEVSNGTENHRVAFGTGEVYLMARNASSYITQEYIANQHVFTGYGDNSSNEAARIDASGNLLVGKTSTNYLTNGVEAKPDGSLWTTATNNGPLVATRKSSDGNIASFYKDNSFVGSIGTLYGDIYVGTGNTGLKFTDSSSVIVPLNTSTLAERDAAINLGQSGTRFKDLYLSGGVYLGGTGAANKLDDYEEGTWTPVITKGTYSPSVTSRSGKYTKIGNRIFFNFYWYSNSAGSSSNTDIWQVSGLPFSVTSGGSGTYQFIMGGYHVISSTTYYDAGRWQANSSTALENYSATRTTNHSSGVLEFSGTGVLGIF